MGYETTYIVRPDATEATLKAIKDRLSKVVESFGGETLDFQDWGKKKLAFTIKKESRGQYLHWQYTGGQGVVAEFERALRLQESVIRFLTVKLEKLKPIFSKSPHDQESATASSVPPTTEALNTV